MLAEHHSGSFSKIFQLNSDKLADIENAVKDTDSTNYNRPFEEHELSTALNSIKTKFSMGGDNIHNCFLTHLPSEAKAKLLNIFNSIYREGSRPNQWKTADIIPIISQAKILRKLQPTDQYHSSL